MEAQVREIQVHVREIRDEVREIFKNGCAKRDVDMMRVNMLENNYIEIRGILMKMFYACIVSATGICIWLLKAFLLPLFRYTDLLRP